MRHEVPQFIEVEARVVGPLTWKQFVYIFGGISIAVALYIVAPFIIFAIIGIPLCILAGALAFQKINNRPLSIFLEAILNYVMRKKLYLWRRSNTEYKSTESNTYTK